MVTAAEARGESHRKLSILRRSVNDTAGNWQFFAGRVYVRGMSESPTTQAGPSDLPPPTSEGPSAVAMPRLCFVGASQRSEVCFAWERRGALLVDVPIEAELRGRLGDAIRDAIEHALAARGAAAPVNGAPLDFESTLGDQLFRARRAGARGLCVVVGALRPIARAGALAAEDSAALRSYAVATRQRPVVLLLAAEDSALGALDAPIALAKLLEPRPDELAAKRPSTPPQAASNDEVEVAEDVWRGWVDALVRARGRQPLHAVERLFAESYTKLASAIAAGLRAPQAIAAHAEFRGAFERTYREAAPTFALTGKRPRLVLDVPDIASRLARLHGARATHLLLVDGMRWELGTAVRDGLTRALGNHASFSEEVLLWAAAPTTTARQLDTLGRGLDALRGQPRDEGEGDTLRGRTAEVIRRVKAGPRDLFKLDVVEARLREAGNGALEAMPAVVDEVVAILARHASVLPARTLFFVFGDHGFAIDESGAARQGGSSPEEVFVPGYAFLLGDAH